ncbi:hypothetical protein GS580_04005, partial [Rhodococcus hoagii]|nr:hypothetical protein [Prescottella equi]
MTGNPITLKESKANGMAALESRASQLGDGVPLSKFVVRVTRRARSSLV